MCFRVFIVFFFLIITQTSFAVKCENFILDDFNFSYEGSELQVSLRDESKQKLNIEFIKNKQSKNITGTIQIKDNEKVLCFEKDIEIPPIKLCKDASGNIAPWRFVTYGETDVLSVVALTANVEDSVVLFNSRICMEANIYGRSYIHNSYIEGGSIIGAENEQVDEGSPDFPRDPSTPPFPEIPKKINFDYYTVKISDVEIHGNPTISGWKKGVFIRNYRITGSPVIFDEISLDGSNKTNKNILEDDGSYSGEAFPKIEQDVLGIRSSQDMLIPIINENLSGNDTSIEGAIFIEREIQNSIVHGEVSRYSGGDIDVMGYISPHATPFKESTFLGFGHIGGEAREGSYIHGYSVPPVTHGILFMSGLLKNGGVLTGALYGEELIVDDAEADGLTSGATSNDSLQLVRVSLNRVEIHGHGYFLDSSLYMSSVTGFPILINAHLSYSDISCNASIHNTTATGVTLGCDDTLGSPFLERNTVKTNIVTAKTMKRFYSASEKIEKDKLNYEKYALNLLSKQMKIRGRR